MFRFVFLSLFLVGVVLLSPLETSAAVTCNGTIKSGVCFPATAGLSDAHVDVLLKRLMNWLLGIFGVIAIIAFVISGLQYLLATGDERMAETAKRNAQYSVVGIIVALSGWVIIRAIDQALSVGGNPLF